MTRQAVSLASLLIILTLPAHLLAQEKIKFPVGVGTKTLGAGLIWLALGYRLPTYRLAIEVIP